MVLQTSPISENPVLYVELLFFAREVRAVRMGNVCSRREDWRGEGLDLPQSKSDRVQIVIRKTGVNWEKQECFD